MNVLLVSQCNKNALKETRRILDQFAERRGDRTWQTAITKAGLATLRKMLRKTARKNTAVACHWIRGTNHSELLWVVGDGSQFNMRGAVPTNITKSNVLRHADENDWHTLPAIKVLAQLAALMHDLGKASVAFQQRLAGTRQERNLYRHEWVSLRLFQAFVGDDNDATWLARLADVDGYADDVWTTPCRYLRDGVDATTPPPFKSLAGPIAKAVGWLIVSHHRMPVVPCYKGDGVTQDRLGNCPKEGWQQAYLQTPLECIEHHWNEKLAETLDDVPAYWQLADALPIGPAWRKQAARQARKLLELSDKPHAPWIDNPYVMHLARLGLMSADHHYSGLGVDADEKPVPERRAFVHHQARLGANTRYNKKGDKVLSQSLDEHLLGVSHTAGLITHALPHFAGNLPTIANHRGLRKRSTGRFAWQNKAADAAVAIRHQSAEHGAFVVNMASTGCGKTLGNARILYSLADPEHGMRATYGLGLRTLTMQTGRAYQKDLHLDDDELATLVGGAASRDLFEYYQGQAEDSGSESIQSLLEEDSHVLFEGNVESDRLLKRAMADPNIRRLLAAPMLVCTVDHVVPATESLRAGRQIAPMLRLLSSDLVLDELDDYSLEDLSALTRLVHWAGMLGSRVVLSSATLPPALVGGMYRAYCAGRKLYLQNRGEAGGQADVQPRIPCLWVDEFNTIGDVCTKGSSFDQAHANFVSKRATQLAKAAPARRARLAPLTFQKKRLENQYVEFAEQVRDRALELHGEHADNDPETGTRVSFGLVRMANINRLFETAKALYLVDVPESHTIHLCVYHARFPLVQRSEIENLLDDVFNRRNDEYCVFGIPAIRQAIQAQPDKEHVFMVLASPVCEVGRDWDADWAVVEPSSARSLIQLAGRVRRHREPSSNKAANLLVFNTNWRGLYPVQKGPVAGLHFVRPGYEKNTEDGYFRLKNHEMHELTEGWLSLEKAEVIDAIPRTAPPAREARQPQQRLIDLEHARTEVSALPNRATMPSETGHAPERDAAFIAWRNPKAALTGVLQQYQPFREQAAAMERLAFLPDEEEEILQLCRVERQKGRAPDLYVPDDARCHRVDLVLADGIVPWATFDLMTLLTEQAEHHDISLEQAAKRFATLEVRKSDQGWWYHPWLGFTQCD